MDYLFTFYNDSLQAINSGSLPRRDECLFTLAYLIRTYTKPEEKHRVYRVVPNLIAEGKELFQFVQFYQILAEPKETGTGNYDNKQTYCDTEF